MRDEVKPALAALADGQHHRLLRIEFPNQDAPGNLLVNRLDAEEGLSRPFEYKVELLSDSAHIALKDMQGKLVAIHLVRGDGSIRYFTAVRVQFWLDASRWRRRVLRSHAGPLVQIFELAQG